MDQIRLYNILRNELHMADEKAADFVSAMGIAVSSEIDAKIQLLATKSDMQSLNMKIEQTKSDLYKVIFLSGLAQFLAIIGSVLAIVKFMR